MAGSDTQRTIEAIWRIESAKIIATLARVVRDVGVAEELAQDALVAALAQWPETGIPDNPAAWLVSTGKHRAIDHLRRKSRIEHKHEELGRELDEAHQTPDLEAALDDDVGDDLLRLMFVACHPLLPAEARVALTLRLLGGLSTAEIARAFLVPEPTIAQRIVRAKRTLAEAGVPFEVPRGGERVARLGSVLEVIYLIFNEGYAATAGRDWMRTELCDEALRLGRILVGLVPGEAEAHGLCALMELHASRAAARVAPNGEPVLLLDQDRRRWDQLLLRRGLAALTRAEELEPSRGAYTLQAAISACHARARSAAETDWAAIAALYAELGQLIASPIIELNRAVAVAMAHGPAAGLEIIDRLTAEPSLRDYHLLPAARGDLLSKLGRHDEARAELERAASLTQNERERKMLLAKARAAIACLAALFTFAATSVVRAGNDDELLVGSRAAMTSGAVAATVMDGSATWYNPAGLGGVTRNQVDVSGTVYTLRLYSAQDFLAVDDGPSEAGSVLEFLSVPNQITYVRELSRGVSLGLGYFVPKASGFRLREQLDAGDLEDGSQWQIALGISEVHHTAAAAVGIALTPSARIGFALIGIYATSAQSVLLSGVVRSGGEIERLLTTSGLESLDRIGGELGVGLQLDLTRTLHAGLSARTPRLLFHESLDAIFMQTSGVRDASGDLELDASLEKPSQAASHVDLLRTGRLGLSVAYDYDALSWIALELDAQPGLDDADIGIARRPVINARLGVLHALSPTVALGAGLFTDRSPDEPATEAISASGDFYGGTIGLELSNEHRLARGERADSLVFSTMFALRYAFSASDLNAAISDPAAPVEEWFRPRRTTLIAHEIGFYVGGGLQF